MKCCGRETWAVGARIQVIFDDSIFKIMEIFRFEAKNNLRSGSIFVSLCK